MARADFERKSSTRQPQHLPVLLKSWRAGCSIWTSGWRPLWLLPVPVPCGMFMNWVLPCHFCRLPIFRPRNCARCHKIIGSDFPVAGTGFGDGTMSRWRNGHGERASATNRHWKERDFAKTWKSFAPISPFPLRSFASLRLCVKIPVKCVPSATNNNSRRIIHLRTN